MFIPALFKIVKKWKQVKCLSRNEWVSKMWYIHKTKYYSAMKNEVLIHVTTQINLKISC